MNSNTPNLNQFFMIIVSAGVIMFMLVYTRPVLVPLIFSFFFYFASLPAVTLLESKLRLPRILALALTAGFVGIIFLTVIFQVSISFRIFFNEIDQYRDTLLGFMTTLSPIASKIGFELDELSYRQLISSIPLKGYVGSWVGDAVGFLGNSMLVIVIYFFLMMGKSKSTKHDSELMLKLKNQISRYVIYKSALSAATGLLVGVILTVFGVDLAVMFGVLTFILNFIPSIGSIIATILPIPVMILNLGLGLSFITVIALCTLVQLVIGSFLDPKIIGNDLDLHPIVMILSLVFWGLLWGLGGMFLAVPLTASIKLILSKLSITKSFSETLAGRSPL